MTTFIDLHVLQTVPSSNINRDDTGSPKSAVFGGVRRARVSSQAWKRATRGDFAAYLPEQDRAIRTRRLVAELVPRIRALTPDLDHAAAAEAAEGVLKAAKLSVNEPRLKKGQERDPEALAQNQYLIFVSSQQLDQLARLAAESHGGTIDRKAAQNAIDTNHGIEIALFGRMVADDKSINVDASVQVAHAISTHAVETEYDYFTAVDDAKTDDEDAGAGMIGVIEFNSSTLYRYATINLDQLMENLGDKEVTGRAVEAFVRSFVVSMPTGKQNTFANSTLPDAVIAIVRPRRPVNLVGAFEEPVVPKPGVAQSVQSALELARQARDVDDSYGNAPAASYVVAVGSDVRAALEGAGEPVTLDRLVESVGQRSVEALRGTA